MLTITQRLGHFHGRADDTVTLDFDTRQKARIKITTDNGCPAGIFIERGKPLLVGECLKSDCGKVIQVTGALEPVITASTDDWHMFAKVDLKIYFEYSFFINAIAFLYVKGEIYAFHLSKLKLL